MFQRIGIVLALLGTVLLGACTTNGNGTRMGTMGTMGSMGSMGGLANMGTKQILGTLGGAAGGGYLGSQMGKGGGQLAFVAAGTLLGAFLGNEIGLSLDRADEAYAQRAFQQAAMQPQIGAPYDWYSPESGNRGSIVMTREGRDTRNGNYCREYQQTIVVGGRPQQAFGTACQMPDGTWQIQP